MPLLPKEREALCIVRPTDGAQTVQPYCLGQITASATYSLGELCNLMNLQCLGCFIC